MNESFDVGQIYQEFRQPLKSFIGKRISNDTATEDILHDVFIRIHNQIGSLKENAKLTSWIYTIARNAVIDFYRKRRLVEESMDHDVLESPVPSDDDKVSEKLGPILRSMVHGLPDGYREALVLADFEGVKQAEIANRLGLSLPGAKSKVQRARRMLKDLLLECCHFEFDRYGTVFDYHAKNCSRCCDSKDSDTSCDVCRK